MDSGKQGRERCGGCLPYKLQGEGAVLTHVSAFEKWKPADARPSVNLEGCLPAD